MNSYVRSIASFFTLLAGCGGGGGGDKASNDNVSVEQPTPVQPSEPALDHSGLSPMLADEVVENEHRLGGDSSHQNWTINAFSFRPDAVSSRFVDDGNFTSGDHIFRTPHPSDGPLMNNNTCQGCHTKDGRGAFSDSGELINLVVKIGDEEGQGSAIYGNQIQSFSEQSFNSTDFSFGLAEYDASVNGDRLAGEARVNISWSEVAGQYTDGSSYSLRLPTVRIDNWSYGPIEKAFGLSPRMAQSVFGSGLLEFIPSEHIVALADPTDSDNNGISGRAITVNDVSTNEVALGRFTYKNHAPSVLHQVANAYHNDMGLTNRYFKQENCEEAQIACVEAALEETKVGDTVDLDDKILALVEFYNRVLAVPSSRGFSQQEQTWDPDFLTGRSTFYNLGCVDCHTPRHVTRTASGSVLGEVKLSRLTTPAPDLTYLQQQTIFPYTDLLLHDMGGQCSSSLETLAGDQCLTGPECGLVQRCDGLADGFPQGQALAGEWRTPPLWGLGLVQTVNPEATFLHDGRARTIEEAILWHGGEALASQQAFLATSRDEREKLLLFLESL